MRRRGLIVAFVAVALGAWLLLRRPSDRDAPEPAPAGGSGEPAAAAPSTGLASLPATAAPGTTFEPPPSAAPGARRLHLVGVGPPDRPLHDVTFEVWTAWTSGGDGRRVRRTLDARRTAPNEAWVALPEDATLAWVDARADRGRLVSPADWYVTVRPGAPDPQTVRVPLLASGEVVVRVTEDGGRPIAGARILDSRGEERAPPTGADGRARIRGAAGSVVVHAEARGYATSPSLQVVVAPGAQEERTLVCARARAIVGRAVDDAGIPLSGEVRGTSSAGGEERRALAADGSFRLESLAVPTVATGSIGLGVIDGDRTRSANASVSGPFAAGEAPLDLGTVTFASRWRVPIRLLSPHGEPLRSVTLAIVREGKAPEPSDRYTVPQEGDPTLWLTTGAYEVRAEPFAVRSPARIAVTGPWRGPPAEVVLDDALLVRGTCVHHGSGTPSWPMLFVKTRVPKQEEQVFAPLDGAGRFALALPERWRDVPLDVETPYATIVSGLVAPADGSDLTVDLPPEQTLALVVRAVDAAGRRIPFAWARFERLPEATPPQGWFGGPSADGDYAFWPLPRGRYHASVDLWDGTRADSGPFELERDGQVVEVTFGR